MPLRHSIMHGPAGTTGQAGILATVRKSASPRTAVITRCAAACRKENNRRQAIPRHRFVTYRLEKVSAIRKT